MKILILMMTVIVMLIIPYAGCNIIQPEEINKIEFEPGFFYDTDSGRIDLFRINSLVAVMFDSNITAENAKNIIHSFNLKPTEMFENMDYRADWNKIISDYIVLMKLPDGAKLEDYLSTFPRSNSNNFSDQEEVNYCLPVFAFDASGDPHSRFIINDEIIVSSKVDSITTMGILESYNLSLYQMTLGLEYWMKLSNNSPANSLEISNSLNEYSEFKWSMPNAYSYENKWP
jgi:hypothetical protein